MSPFYLTILIISSMFLPVFIWMIYCGIKVKTTYARYSRVAISSNLTAREVARKILDENGLHTVQICECKGHLTDHYDPTSDTIYLSSTTIASNSIAAVGVAAHEVGHAIQYAEGYAPVKIRTALVPAVNFTSRASMPLILVALLLEIFAYGASGFLLTISNFLLVLALLCYATYCLFTFITLPTEYNASKRAKEQLLDLDILSQSEHDDAAKVLKSAANTYLSSFAFSIIQFSRILLILLSRRNRR